MWKSMKIEKVIVIVVPSVFLLSGVIWLLGYLNLVPQGRFYAGVILISSLCLLVSLPLIALMMRIVFSISDLFRK